MSTFYRYCNNIFDRDFFVVSVAKDRIKIGPITLLKATKKFWTFLFMSTGLIVAIEMDHLTVWPDWAIYWTLGKFLATINLPKYHTFLGNFWEGVKIYHFSSEIIFGQLL